ncbi:MAG: YhbY family RNA-binding protein [Eubacteriaceae bacterium]|nr:YhbY family RNA-binding protein [Eubacteriaceae bacterium]MDD4507690.1 YhbY family RNA-binding protein [Eubacteriaceae bacterium]
MLTSKQRSHLRSLSNKIPAIIMVGKDGVNETLIEHAREAIVARELIKGKVQQNASISSSEAAEMLASSIKAELVCVMGNTFVLFKRNPQHIRIQIPSKKKATKS